jgi:uncharacterized protein
LEVDWLIKELRCKAKQPLLLIFDEIQELGSAPDGDNIVASLRSAITKSKEHIRVVFTGSSQIKLIEMFARPRAALYDGASTLPFPLLGDDFLRFVGDRCKTKFKRSPTLGELKDAFERLHARPRNLIDLVLTYASSDAVSLTELVEQGLLADLSDRDFDGLWTSLSGLQRRICLRIASGKDVSSTDARQFYAVLANGKKAQDISPGLVSGALKVLIKQHVLSNPGRGIYRFDDPLFADWLKNQMPSPP